MDLPLASKVHPVFHVSLLKKMIAPDCQVLSQLPSPDDQFQFPEQVLQQRVVRRGSNSIVQLLVKWNATPVDMAVWRTRLCYNKDFLGHRLGVKPYLREEGLSATRASAKKEFKQKHGPRVSACWAGVGLNLRMYLYLGIDRIRQRLAKRLVGVWRA